MENVFKEKLIEMFEEKNATKTFSEALIGKHDWLLESREQEITPKNDISEKSLVMESFSRFAHEKVQESITQVYSFSGGEIVEKPTLQQGWKNKFENKAQFLDQFFSHFPQEAQSFYLDKSRIQPKVLLFTESFLKEDEKAKSGLPLDFALYFKSDVGELLLKMIEALKLSPTDYLLCSTSEFSTDELYEFIYWMRPQVVIPFGATSTKKITQSSEKLSQIHGKTTSLNLLGEVFQTIPLFHPSVLVGNVNMKKTTWVDMQEIIKILQS